MKSWKLFTRTYGHMEEESCNNSGDAVDDETDDVSTDDGG